MKTNKLPDYIFSVYVNAPLRYDESVREFCGIPDNRYFTVSIWPIRGIVTLTNLTRTVTAKKISKSDHA